MGERGSHSGELFLFHLLLHFASIFEHQLLLIQNLKLAMALSNMRIRDLGLERKGLHLKLYGLEYVAVPGEPFLGLIGEQIFRVQRVMLLELLQLLCQAVGPRFLRLELKLRLRTFAFRLGFGVQLPLASLVAVGLLLRVLLLRFSLRLPEGMPFGLAFALALATSSLCRPSPGLASPS